MKITSSKKGKVMLRCFAFAKAVTITSLLLLSCKEKSTHIAVVKADQIAVDSTLQTDASIEDFITPYKKSVDENMNEPLSYNPVAMHKNDYKFNTPISNMMAEIIKIQGDPILESREGKKIDVVLLNHGGIRAPLDKGAVTMRNAYEIMPFENSIVVADLTAEKMQELINYLVEKKRAHPIAGLQIKLDKNGKLEEALINGATIDTSKVYAVATNDYLYNGGDNMSFFKDTPITRLDYKIRNAMIDYFKVTDTLDFKRDDRFTMAN